MITSYLACLRAIDVFNNPQIPIKFTSQCVVFRLLEYVDIRRCGVLFNHCRGHGDFLRLISANIYLRGTAVLESK